MTHPSCLRRLVFASLLASSIALTSCEPIQKLIGGGEDGGGGSAPAQAQVRIVNGFAIIDLNEIAQRTGRSAALQNAISSRERQLVQELVKLQNNFQQQVNQRQELIGTEPSEEQQKELANFASALNVRFNQARATAKRTLSDDQVKLIQRFRSEVLPIAAKVAGERGLTTILTKNDAVLYAWDPNYEITEEVIRRMATPMVP